MPPSGRMQSEAVCKILCSSLLHTLPVLQQAHPACMFQKLRDSWLGVVGAVLLGSSSLLEQGSCI